MDPQKRFVDKKNKHWSKNETVLNGIVVKVRTAQHTMQRMISVVRGAVGWNEEKDMESLVKWMGTRKELQHRRTGSSTVPQRNKEMKRRSISIRRVDIVGLLRKSRVGGIFTRRARNFQDIGQIG